MWRDGRLPHLPTKPGKQVTMSERQLEQYLDTVGATELTGIDENETK